MKFLERLALVLFSIIMLCLSVISCLVIFDIVELKTIYNFLDDLITNQTACRIILGSCVVAVLLAIKALFFPTKINKRQEIKTGVLLENKDGRLLISRDTIENLINSVVKSFDQAVDVQTKVNLDAENNITVYVSLLVKEESVIKELSSNIQNKIKDTIKRSTDLNVSQVNINVKDIENNKNGKNVNVKTNTESKIKVNDIKTNENQTKDNQVVSNLDENTKESAQPIN
ncbi:MAG: alkaline shock response membrane anchor protein AmaP [Clostridia bacterium]|nr:alkaline shock response membrane anchor protein AmaP [Clostridia bacterium]